MGGLSVEVKLCRGDCSVVVSSEKFASPFTLAVEQICASVEHYKVRSSHMTAAMQSEESCCREPISILTNLTEA